VKYYTHGATLALAWFFATNAICSIVVALAAHRIGGSARRLLIARLLPALASIGFVAALFIPSYVRFEPRDIAEGVDVTLAATAAIAFAMLAAGAVRGASAWWRAGRRARLWMRAASPVELKGCAVPAFQIDAPRPLMALAGIVRPQLIVSTGLIEALTPEELAAAVAHELGHHRARDNFKRLAMRAAPDVLRWLGPSHGLERRWAAAAEHTADRSASSAGDRTRFALASALVKVARLMPAQASTGEPISTLVGGGEIAARVRDLVNERPSDPTRRSRVVGRLLLGVAVVALALGYAPMLEQVHHATEVLVSSLP